LKMNHFVCFVFLFFSQTVQWNHLFVLFHPINSTVHLSFCVSCIIIQSEQSSIINHPSSIIKHSQSQSLSIEKVFENVCVENIDSLKRREFQIFISLKNSKKNCQKKFS
jgi:hypothetical protein